MSFLGYFSGNPQRLRDQLPKPLSLLLKLISPLLMQTSQIPFFVYFQVIHGNIETAVGRLRYPIDPLPYAILIIASVCGFLVLLLIVAGLVLRSRIKSHEEETNKLLIEMQNLETNIADDIRTGKELCCYSYWLLCICDVIKQDEIELTKQNIVFIFIYSYFRLILC